MPGLNEKQREIEWKRSKGIEITPRDHAELALAQKQLEGTQRYGQTSSKFSGVLPQHTGTASLIGQSEHVAKSDHTHAGLEAETKPYGFVDNTQTTIAYDDSTYTFTITDAGSGWDYYRNGVLCHVVGNKTVVLGSPPATGIYYIYMDATDGTLSSSSTAFTFSDTRVAVAVVLWNASNTPKYYLMDERHTCLMPRATHRLHHFSEGTEFISGATVSGQTVSGTTDAENTCGISEAIIADEDLWHTIAALTDPNGTVAAYTNFYRTSTSAWSWDATSEVPFKYTNAGYINYDNAGTLTQGQHNKWYNYYLILTNLTGTGFIFVPGRSEFSSAAAAYAEDYRAFSWAGLNITEYVIAYQFTWNTNSSFTTKGKCQLTRTPVVINVSTTGVSGGMAHNALSGLQGGTTGEYYHQTAAAYVATVTSVPTDSGTATPTTNALTISGGEGIDTSATGTTVTIAGEDATVSNKGIASFATADFNVTSGAVELKDTVVKQVGVDSGLPAIATPTGHSFSIFGGEGIDTTSVDEKVYVAGEDATSSNKGIASFSTDNFLVSSGAVTIKDKGVALAEMADMNTNRLLGRQTALAGAPEEITVADGEGIDSNWTTAGTLTIAGELASDTNKGVASFDNTDFIATTGVITLHGSVPQSVASDSGSATPSTSAFTIAGGEGIDTSATGATVTIAGEDATSSNKGIASFSTDNFSVTSGAVTIKDQGVALAEMADMATNRLLGRQTALAGAPEVITVADGEGIDTNWSTAATLTIAAEDATTTNKGVASFDTNDFDVTSGAVSYKDTTVRSVASDSGSATPATHAFTIAGGEGIDTSATGATVTIAGEDATDTNKGVASFAAADFDVASGAVSLEDTVVKSVTCDGPTTATPSTHSITVTGGEGIDTTASGATITVAGEDATTTNKGIASFNTSHFSVTSGAVSLGVVPINNGGTATGASSWTDGQLLIGNTTGNTASRSTLTEGEGIDITNGHAAITIAIESASDSNIGGAKFDANDFTIAAGTNVQLKAASVAMGDLANMTTHRLIGRQAIDPGAPTEITVADGEGIDTDWSTANTLTIVGEDATTTNKGIASFDTNDFTVTSGAVTIKDGGIDHAGLTNLNSASYTHLTSTNHTDLTDGGATTLHKHDHGGMDGLTDNDHPQYALLTDGGWFPDSDTWVYVSASSFKVEGKDVSSRFTVGTKLKMTQTSVKYFYVVSVAFSTDTTVTVTGGSDYTVANAAITSPYYSYAANPQAFPHWFAYAPTLTGFSSDPTNSSYRFSVIGRTVTLEVRNGSAGTSNDTVFRVSLPINAATADANAGWYGGFGFGVDNGTLTTDGSAAITASANTYVVVNRANNAAWTASGNKRAGFTISYEI